MLPDAVLFDFGGTLDSDGIPWVARFHAAYVRHGGTLDPDSFARYFSESDVRLAAHAHIRDLNYTGMLALQAEVLRQVISAVLPLERELDWESVGAAVRGDCNAVIARNRDLLALLHRHTRIGIVSNFTGNLEHCLSELDLARHVDVVSDSTLVGSSKPEPAIFHRTLAALGIRREPGAGPGFGASWMVGDNPYADVRAGCAVGLSTCWLAPAGRAVPEGCEPTARISQLPELMQVLGVHSQAEPLHGDPAAPSGSGESRTAARRESSCTV